MLETGMRKEVTAFPTLVHRLYDNEKTFANRVYLRQPILGQWHEYTWQKTMELARRLVTFFKAQGLKKGDTVAILSKNCAEWYITDFAIMMAGLISVPLYSTQDKEVIHYILTKTKVKLVVLGKLDDWPQKTDCLPTNVITLRMSYDKKIQANFNWEDVIEKYQPTIDNYLPDPDDVLTIVFTSGTTGNPKGAVMTYRTQRNAAAISNEIFMVKNPGQNRLLSYLPLAHILERSLEFATVDSFTEVSFAESIDTFGSNLQQVSPTLFAGVPRIWNILKLAISNNVPQKKIDFILQIPVVSYFVKRKIRKKLGLNDALCFSGAAPIPRSRLEWFQKLGIEIYQGYGATETFGLATIETEKAHKLGSIGQAYPGIDIKISGDGEILIKTDSRMLCYFEESEKTENAFTDDGYYHTGDKGYLDEEGFLFINGRTAETFKTTKGEFVHPDSIEHKFALEKNFEHMAIVGFGLRQPVLIVQLTKKGKEIIPEKLVEHLTKLLEEVNKTLTSFERVSTILISDHEWSVESGHLTPTLKIKRYNLQEKYKDILPSLCDYEDKIIWEKDLKK